MEEVKKETMKTTKEAAESRLGVRYSVLLALPYFDSIRSVAIDIMHNLFLGSGKHAFAVWVDNEILTKAKMIEIENNLKLFHVPSGIGQVPSSIASSYGSFTAASGKTG